METDFQCYFGKKIQRSKIIHVDLNILAVAVSKIFALLFLKPYDFKCLNSFGSNAGECALLVLVPKLFCRMKW